MKTKKLAIAAVVALVFPTMSFADNGFHSIGTSDEDIHPKLNKSGVPQWVIDAQQKPSMNQDSLEDLESNDDGLSSYAVQLSAEDDLVIPDEVFMEADTTAENEVLAFINDRIKVDLTSKNSHFEEIDQYNAEIKRVELRSELAKQETDVILSQLEIKRLRDELKIDRTREYLKEQMLVVYNKKVRELNTENNLTLYNLENELKLEMNNKVEELNALIDEKDATISKERKDSEAAMMAKEYQILVTNKEHEEVMKKVTIQVGNLNNLIDKLEYRIEVLEAEELERYSDGNVVSDDIALANIVGREGNLRAKIYFENEIIEVREDDDILNAGQVYVKEINQSYIILYFIGDNEEATLYPMGDARAATYVYNQQVKNKNKVALANYNEQLEKQAKNKASLYDQEMKEKKAADNRSSSNIIDRVPKPQENMTFPDLSTLYNAYGKKIASGLGS